MILQTDERFFVVTCQHTFAGREVDGFGKVVDTDNLHLVQVGFLDDILVIRFVRQDEVFVIGEDGKVVFLCFLFEIGDPFRIDALLE